MPVVEVNVGARVYQLGCDHGQEGHLQKLAENVNQRLQEMASLADGASDMTLLVMTSLMLQDELNEADKSLKNVESLPFKSVAEQTGEVNRLVAEAMDAIAGYIETVAAKLETR